MVGLCVVFVAVCSSHFALYSKYVGSNIDDIPVLRQSVSATNMFCGCPNVGRVVLYGTAMRISSLWSSSYLCTPSP